MLRDIISFEQVWSSLHGSSSRTKAVVSFVRFLERKLGGQFVYDRARIGFESASIARELELAEMLRSRGIISAYGRSPMLPDEPRVQTWHAHLMVPNEEETAGGIAVDDDAHALTAMLAEALERYLWFVSTNQFGPIHRASITEAGRPGYLSPERFASYSKVQRDADPRLNLKGSDIFSWVRGYSWVQNESVWIPLQTVSGHPVHRASGTSGEPAIRPSITTGLATNPSRIGAVVAGALEVIERDAYIITWLNQLSPSRINVDELALRDRTLARLVSRCRRYRLEPHILRLPTDAPAYAIAALIEDNQAQPRFSIGTKADRDPARAAEGALLEALRAHQKTRRWRRDIREEEWDPDTKASDVTRRNRVLYWSEGDHGNRLKFLIQGEWQPLKNEAWKDDTDDQYLARIAAWCRTKGYELASVSFTDATARALQWHIEFVVIPELQPLYYNEKLPCIGGDRLRDVPHEFGYASRAAYLDDPHPFT